MVLRGNAASRGVAIGKIYIHRPFEAAVREHLCAAGQEEEQLRLLQAAKEKSLAELRAIFAMLEETEPDKAKIFSAHEDIVRDEALQEEMEEGIRYGQWAGDWAIAKVFDKFTRMLQKAPDLLIRERAADLKDVCARLLRNWYGVEERNLALLTEPVVVAAHDLLPSDTATLDRTKVMAILTEVGGQTSHSAILARAYQIPAVLGIPNLLEKVADGRLAAVDARTGEVILDPSEDQIADHEGKRAQFMARAAGTDRYLNTEPRMADGVRVDIGLNIGSADGQELAGEAYSDFVGLFRTEFLYMSRGSLPDEEEQFQAYKQVLSAFRGRPVTLRTLDIGGDKMLECLPLPKEDNPFLGNRALRLCFSRPELFRVQLRAALRASVYGELWLMFPMVSSMDDLRAAKEMVYAEQKKLAAAGVPVSGSIKLGIMIEVPSIAVIADLVVREVDFASIGTNDLCQYMMAADRLNPAVAQYYQSYHPALLRVIASVVAEFNRAGKPVSVCGEMGGDTLAAPVLIGMGLRKLSMGSGSVAPIKQLLTRLDAEKTQRLAKAALSFSTAWEVEEYLKKQLAEE